jgi:hypothetical protein
VAMDPPRWSVAALAVTVDRFPPMSARKPAG